MSQTSENSTRLNSPANEQLTKLIRVETVNLILHRTIDQIDVYQHGTYEHENAESDGGELCHRWRPIAFVAAKSIGELMTAAFTMTVKCRMERF